MCVDDIYSTTDPHELARNVFANHRGVGMVPPFYAESASTKNDPDWPWWIVRNKSCRSVPFFMERDLAEKLSDAMNALSVP